MTDAPRVKTGGRQKGSLNKATADVKALAQKYGQTAMKTLVHIAKNGEDERARIAAANIILDRAYGKVAQGVELSGGVETVHKIERPVVRPPATQ